MDKAADNLEPATRDDLADALAFALRHNGRKRVHRTEEIMAAIVAKRLVEHLDRSGFVVMRRPPATGVARSLAGLTGRRANDDDAVPCAVPRRLFAAWFGASQEFQDDLVMESFKFALDDREVLDGWHVSNGWDFVASAIKIAMEAVPDGKVIFLDFPSISVIRRFWYAVIHAYVTHLQREAKAPLDSWKILDLLDIWKGHPGWTDEMEARYAKAEELMKANLQKKAAKKATTMEEQMKKCEEKFGEADAAKGA